MHNPGNRQTAVGHAPNRGNLLVGMPDRDAKRIPKHHPRADYRCHPSRPTGNPAPCVGMLAHLFLLLVIGLHCAHLRLQSPLPCPLFQAKNESMENFWETFLPEGSPPAGRDTFSPEALRGSAGATPRAGPHRGVAGKSERPAHLRNGHRRHPCFLLSKTWSAPPFCLRMRSDVLSKLTKSSCMPSHPRPVSQGGTGH